MIKNVLVVGLGHVGTAIYELLEDNPNYLVQDKDVADKQIFLPIDIMHICFPYTDKFAETAEQYMTQFKPRLTIIESTVLPKTTQKIYAKTQMPICHSPVRGREDLKKELLRYTKFIGSPKREWAFEAEKYYNSLGIKTLICSSPLETEFMKLLNTTYYALMITFFQEIRRICNKHEVNEAEIKTFFQTNTIESGLQHIRPILYPGIIGGYCLLPNLELLRQIHPSALFDAILISNEKMKQSEISNEQF